MPKCLISVSDKTGLDTLAPQLELLGFEIISTGGTYKHLAELGIKGLQKIEDYTGFPEIMDGRVKTLHPLVFGGILAERGTESHLQDAQTNGIELIDLVICNLYPFKKTVVDSSKTEEEIIENIDIGGVTLLRAAAKNFKSVWVLVDSDDYQNFINGFSLPANEQITLRKKLAQKAFAHTADYDNAIQHYLAGTDAPEWNFEKKYDLRYGENPHQKASFYVDKNFAGMSIANAEILHGKELSYNNLLDADCALALIREFSEPAAAVIKHNNPCGAAIADDIETAFSKAYETDSVSAFGGIIILNRNCTIKIAEFIQSVFVEVVIAPGFEEGSLEILQQKKNIRIIRTGPISQYSDTVSTEYKSITGGLLLQDADQKAINQDEFKLVSQKKPAEQDLRDLIFAFSLTRHMKSNTIALVSEGCTIGLGGGQTSRIAAVEIALRQAGEKAKNAVCASDGFFPFADSIEALAASGIRAIVQPGGSVKDSEVIAAADQHGICMVFTGHRTFKH